MFVASWAGNSRTEEGNTTYLGMGEGEWRALLNPVVAIWLADLWTVRGRQRPHLAAAGFWLVFAGLALALVGNVLEFGLLGEPFLDESPPGSGSWSLGWAPVLFGAGAILIGLLLLALGSVQRRFA